MLMELEPQTGAQRRIHLGDIEGDDPPGAVPRASPELLRIDVSPAGSVPLGGEADDSFIERAAAVDFDLPRGMQAPVGLGQSCLGRYILPERMGERAGDLAADGAQCQQKLE